MSVYFNGKKVSIASTTKVYGGKYNVTAEDKEDGTQKLIINTTPTNPAIVPTGTIDITENGQVDVTKYAFANVNVENGSSSIDFASFVDGSMTDPIIIPEGVTYIRPGIFEYLNSISYTIPSTVTSIGNYAFGFLPTNTSIYYKGTLNQ